jgi:hypothetical protein
MKKAILAAAAILTSLIGFEALADQLSPISKIAGPAGPIDRPTSNGTGGSV